MLIGSLASSEIPFVIRRVKFSSFVCDQVSKIQFVCYKYWRSYFSFNSCLDLFSAGIEGVPFIINPKLHKSKELKHFTPNGSSMTLEELDNLVSSRANLLLRVVVESGSRGTT